MAKKALDRIQERFNQDPQIGLLTTILPGGKDGKVEILKRERELGK